MKGFQGHQDWPHPPIIILHMYYIHMYMMHCISQVLIHEEPFDDTFIRRPDGYYNSRRCCGDLISGPLDADGLLAAFNFGRWDEFCLAHLFTFVDFDSGLLGLANIAGFFQSQTGGICSECKDIIATM